ncbi:MAG TPA: hypothetical protein VF721_22510, partial [Pyrinomonadaceae bacterium]
KAGFMKKHLLPCGIFILLFSLAAFSQTPAPTPQNQTKNQTTTDPDEKNSDLVITANVRARELKVEIVPNPDVKFPGKPDRQTVWEADRENLPEKIEPGVTYRDIGIRLRIYSRFAEIQRIVLEALDEEPPATVVNQASPVETPENKALTPPTEPVARKTKPKTARTGRTRK